MKFGILKGLDGRDLKDANDKPIAIYQSLANVIVNEIAKDSIVQRHELATKIFNSQGSELEISESEKEIIKQAVTSGGVTVLLAAQVLNIINNAKD